MYHNPYFPLCLYKSMNSGIGVLVPIQRDDFLSVLIGDGSSAMVGLVGG